MFEREIGINRFLLQYGERMVADVADERLAEQPLAGVNHPAWILGHLAYSADRACAVLGGEKHLDKAWHERFGPGSTMTDVRSDYPPKAELLATVAREFERARELAALATAEQVAQTNPNRMLRGALPTVHDAVSFLLTGHLGIHLGQLSAWRRMIGLAPLF
jgi:hypothetical protein